MQTWAIDCCQDHVLYITIMDIQKALVFSEDTGWYLDPMASWVRFPNLPVFSALVKKVYKILYVSMTHFQHSKYMT